MFTSNRLACSFCGRPADEVSKLVAGAHAYICDRCVAIASDIMGGRGNDTDQPPTEQGFWTRLRQRVGKKRAAESKYRAVSA